MRMSTSQQGIPYIVIYPIMAHKPKFQINPPSKSKSLSLSLHLLSLANGMSAEQVLRTVIVKVLFRFTYQELAFHIVDSKCIRLFCQIGIADQGFNIPVVNNNIKVLSEKTWQSIRLHLFRYAKKNKIEYGRLRRCTWKGLRSLRSYVWVSIVSANLLTIERKQLT